MNTNHSEARKYFQTQIQIAHLESRLSRVFREEQETKKQIEEITARLETLKAIRDSETTSKSQ